MSDSLSDLSPVTLTFVGARRCLGLGAAVGALELWPVVLQSALPMSVVEVVVFVALNVLIFTALGGLVGALVGPPVHLLLRRLVVSRGLAAQMGITMLVLLGYVFGGLAWDEVSGGRPWAAAFLGVFPFLAGGITFLVAGRFWRMAEMGLPAPAPFFPVAAGSSLLLGGIAGGIVLARPTGGAGGLPTDPNFVVVVVDSLRADLGSERAPSFDRLATQGVVFTGAITPSPATAPAVSSILSGLPPLVHGVVEDGDQLRRVRSLLPYVFASEGYAVGGFVSDVALSADRGFSYGYHAYDDDFGWSRGFSKTRVGRDLSALGLRRVNRRDGATVDRFLDWLARTKDAPFFALVHLHGPREPFVPHGLPGFEANGTTEAPVLDHAALLGRTDLGPTEMRMLHRLYGEEVAAVDRELGRILDALAAHGLDGETAVVVVGTGGELLAEHGNAYTHQGLFDETVRVPLLLRIPKIPGDRAIPVQVRIHDLYPTLLEYAQIPSRQESSAISLLERARTGEGEPLWSSLLGRDLDGGWLIGARNNGWKYLRRLDDGSERLFQTEEDPEELRDLAPTLPETLAEARNLVVGDLGKMGKALGVTPKPVP